MRCKLGFLLACISIVFVQLPIGTSATERDETAAAFEDLVTNIGTLLCSACVLWCAYLRSPEQLEDLRIQFQGRFPEWADKYDVFIEKLVCQTKEAIAAKRWRKRIKKSECKSICTPMVKHELLDHIQKVLYPYPGKPSPSPIDMRNALLTVSEYIDSEQFVCSDYCLG